MLRKVVVGSSLLALVPSVSAATPVKDEPARPMPMRPSDLPIYEAPHAEYGEYVDSKKHSGKNSFIRAALQGPVSMVREQVQSVWVQTDSIKTSIRDNYHEFQDRTDWIVRYLREEENKEFRYGAVVMGSLTGVIFGLRGGIFRRVFYSGVGTTVMGMICFPEETKELVKNNGSLAKQYINIAYNFLYGGQMNNEEIDAQIVPST